MNIAHLGWEGFFLHRNLWGTSIKFHADPTSRQNSTTSFHEQHYFLTSIELGDLTFATAIVALRHWGDAVALFHASGKAIWKQRRTNLITLKKECVHWRSDFCGSFNIWVLRLLQPSMPSFLRNFSEFILHPVCPTQITVVFLRE